MSSSTADMFLDDSNICTSRSSGIEIQEHINQDFDNIHQWLLANKLTLNEEKTEYMITGPDKDFLK